MADLTSVNPKNVDVLNGLKNQMNNVVDTVQVGQPKKEDGSPITDPDELKAYYQQLADAGLDVAEIGNAINDVGNQHGEMHQNLQDASRSVMSNVYFSLTAQSLPKNEFVSPDIGQGGVGSNGGFGVSEEKEDLFENDISLDNVQFKSAEDVKDVLLAIGNPEIATDLFFKKFGQENGLVRDPDQPERISADDDAIREPISEFFSTDDRDVQDKAAQFLFNVIVSEGSKVDDEPETVINNEQNERAASIIEQTNSLIKKIASQKINNNIFNVKKEAQAKSLQNVIMYGPEEKKTDQFLGGPISDWHLVERNKGFGLRVDDVWNIDWEKIWRENIMDKYTPAQQDADGNWVGGFIQDKYEVDKNIPALNNMQLKPGEKRKATPPEFSHTEARLEESRGKAYNWAKEASSSQKTDKNSSDQSFNLHRELKKKVTAKKDDFGKLPTLDSPLKIKQPQRWCTICGAKMRNATGDFKGNPNECPSCHAIVSTPLTSDPQLNKSQTGVQEGPPVNRNYIPVNVNLQASGIFFNGNKFICIANNQKEYFDTYNEAEAFQNTSTLPVDNSLNQNTDDIEECDTEVADMNDVQKEKHLSMHHLAIDE